MIDVKYDRTKNTTVVSIDAITTLDELLPVKILFKNIVTDEIHYETSLMNGMWCAWSGAELITDVLIYSNKGELIHVWNWDVTENGDCIEKLLWYYLVKRKNQGFKSSGLVIGTHDGRNGHWIYPVKKNLSFAKLVDGSEIQFSKLVNNYKYYTNVELKNTIVTVDGSDVTWYQGGEGYTDTVKKDLIEEWLEKDQISKIEKRSVSINSLLNERDYDWIHLDVEGIDADLILSLNQKPNIIIYESMNLSDTEKISLGDFFESNGYRTSVCNGNTIAIKT